MKLEGRLMSETLVFVVTVMVEGRGLERVMWWEVDLRTGVVSSTVPMIPGGVDLKVTR